QDSLLAAQSRRPQSDRAERPTSTIDAGGDYPQLEARSRRGSGRASMGIASGSLAVDVDQRVCAFARLEGRDNEAYVGGRAEGFELGAGAVRDDDVDVR